MVEEAWAAAKAARTPTSHIKKTRHRTDPGGVLTIAATRDTVYQGMALLFVFSMGLGVPFVLTGLGLRKAFGALKAMRRWMRPINLASGFVMVAFGLLLFTNNVTRLSSFFVEIFTAVPFLENLASI
jgi:thiol:disulfide interchange protein